MILTAAGCAREQKENHRPDDGHHETRQVEAKVEAPPGHKLHDQAPNERANNAYDDVEKTTLALVGAGDHAGHPTSQRAKDDPGYDAHSVPPLLS